MSLQYATYNETKNTACAFKNGMYKYYLLKDEKKNEGVEFCCGIFPGGKSKTNVTTKDKQHFENVNEKIRENFVNSMTKIIQKNATDVVNKNKQDMLVALKAANIMRFNNIKGKEFTVSGVNQSNFTKAQAEMAAENTTITKITTSVSTKTSAEINESVTDSNKQGESLTAMLDNALEAVGGVANNYINTAGDVMKEGIGAAAGVAGSAVDGLLGNTSETNTNTETDFTSIQKIMDKAKTEINLEESIENSISNKVNNDSLQACAMEISSNNTMVFENIDVSGDVNITNIEQKNVIQSFLNCQFKNETVNEIVNDMITDLSDKLTKSELTEVEQEGFGAAIAAAAEGVGSGISEAATGVGEGVGSAAEGVGNGVGSVFEGIGGMFGSMTWLLIACCCLFLIGVLGFVAMGGIGQTTDAAQTMKK
tara:strand:+ start:8517 stop:9788 length:1272 start_codon:yes stop_codon:yes gene_type:complete